MGTTPGRRHRRTMATFYAAYGTSPWSCGECGELVLEMGYRSGNVHHKDGNVTNDDPGNLEALHPRCHIAHKHPVTDEMKHQISAKLKGRPSSTKGMKFSDETNRKKAQYGILNGYYGKTHSPEIRAKMRKPRPRVICKDCGKEYAKNWVTRHKQEGACVS